MIAACQHGDRGCLAYCADALGGPAGQSEVAEAGTGFAATLAAFGHCLLPVPQDVLRDVAERRPKISYY